MSRFSGETLRILVAEDEIEHITILRRMLVGQKAELKHVDTLEKLLTQATVWGPDVILLDLRLDATSDFMVTARTVVSHFPAVPVIAWTAIDDEEAAMRALRAGLAAFITKGTLNGNDLIRKIREAIARSEGPGKTMMTGNVQDIMREAAKEVFSQMMTDLESTGRILTGDANESVDEYEEELSETSFFGVIKQAKKWWPILGGLATILAGIVGLGWQAREYKDELASDKEVEALFEKHSKNGHAEMHEQVEEIGARLGGLESDDAYTKKLIRYNFLIRRFEMKLLEYKALSPRDRAKANKPTKSKELQDLEDDLMFNQG